MFKEVLKLKLCKLKINITYCNYSDKIFKHFRRTEPHIDKVYYMKVKIFNSHCVH